MSNKTCRGTRFAGASATYGLPHHLLHLPPDPRDQPRRQRRGRSALTDNAFERDGRRYGHILDPRTLRPVEGMRSVTVIAPTATAADALSTGFFVLGADALPLCVDGVEARIVPEEGETLSSPDWPNR